MPSIKNMPVGNGNGYGDGSGNGYGYGDGFCSGDGYGDGYGYGTVSNSLGLVGEARGLEIREKNDD